MGIGAEGHPLAVEPKGLDERGTHLRARPPFGLPVPEQRAVHVHREDPVAVSKMTRPRGISSYSQTSSIGCSARCRRATRGHSVTCASELSRLLPRCSASAMGVTTGSRVPLWNQKIPTLAMVRLVC